MRIEGPPPNPANTFHRNIRFGPRKSPLHLPILLRLVEENRDFQQAVQFFKMGFPLNICMRGVGWPQNRYELPDALYKPDPPLVDGCPKCRRRTPRCCCSSLIKKQRPLIPIEGYLDYEGMVWPYYQQSMEDGYKGETFLLEHWSDEYEEWTVARSLNGQRVACQLQRQSSGRTRYWSPVDPWCTCAQIDQPTHESWEECPTVDLTQFHMELVIEGSDNEDMSD